MDEWIKMCVCFEYLTHFINTNKTNIFSFESFAFYSCFIFHILLTSNDDSWLHHHSPPCPLCSAAVAIVTELWELQGLHLLSAFGLC